MTCRNGALTALIAFATLCTTAAPTALATDSLPPDEITRAILQDAEFPNIAVSPDGTKLAIARRSGDTTSVTVHERIGLKPLINFDSGTKGVISHLQWLDDKRLLVGATRIGTLGYANFDPEHIHVLSCDHATRNIDCNLPQVWRKGIAKDAGKGELLIQGPVDSAML